MENVNKRARDESESEIDSPEVKRLRENLLEGLDDDDPEFSSSNQDLDSFMKSFEEEITASPSAVGGSGSAGDGVELVDLVSQSDDSRPDLGYLLGASDDELGIPPPPASPVVGEENVLKTELVRDESKTSDFGGEFWDGPGYDSFGFGLGEDAYVYEELDGLFDYSDLGFGFGDVSRRPETLPAQ